MIPRIAFLTWIVGFAAVPVRSQEPSEDLRNLRGTPAGLAAHLDRLHLIVLRAGFDCSTASPSRPTYWNGHIRGAMPVEWSDFVQNREACPGSRGGGGPLIASAGGEGSVFTRSSDLLRLILPS